MKQTLTFITFLLLLLPVWKSCDSHRAAQNFQEECPIIDTLDIDDTLGEVIDTLDVSYNEVDTVSADNNIEVVDTAPKETAFDNFLKIFEWDENCQSGYNQVWGGIGFLKDKKDETKNAENENIENKEDEKEKISVIERILITFLFFSFIFSFTVYFLISIVLAVFSFIKKRKTFIWLSGINLFIIVWAYISYFWYSSNYYQIKFGFYLLIINSLLILLSNFLWKKR